MRSRVFLQVLVIALLASGCVQYSEVREGVNSIGRMEVVAKSGWKSVRASDIPHQRRSSRTWTVDGLDSERLMLIPRIGEGDALFRDDAVELPEFRPDMTNEEIAELVESSLTLILASSDQSLSVSNVREQAYGLFGGFMFDINGSLSASQEYGGFAGGFVYEDELYLSIFLAAKPDAYERHKDAAMELVKSTTLSQKTIRMY